MSKLKKSIGESTISSFSFPTAKSEVSATVSRVAEKEEAPDPNSPASLMTPNSTPAPGAAGSPHHKHQDQAEGQG